VVFGVKSTMAALAGVALLAGAVFWPLWSRARRGALIQQVPCPPEKIPTSLCGPGHSRAVQRFRGGPNQAVSEQARAIPFVWIGLLFPPALYFAISMTSDINLGVRHLLPVYPFLYAAVAALLAKLSVKRVFRYAMVGLAAVHIAECASIYPDYLAFFNAVSGGPGNGPRSLVDSNIDWGQDVKKLKNWLNVRGTNRVWIGYFGKAEMRYYGLDFRNPPEALDQEKWDQIDGFVAASVTLLNGVYLPLARLAPLRLREPIAKVGYSIYIYDFHKNSSGRSRALSRPGKSLPYGAPTDARQMK
jgi:hypothetical protein